MFTGSNLLVLRAVGSAGPPLLVRLPACRLRLPHKDFEPPSCCHSVLRSPRGAALDPIHGQICYPIDVKLLEEVFLEPPPFWLPWESALGHCREMTRWRCAHPRGSTLAAEQTHGRCRRHSRLAPPPFALSHMRVIFGREWRLRLSKGVTSMGSFVLLRSKLCHWPAMNDCQCFGPF
jgi:hypothetical protein